MTEETLEKLAQLLEQDQFELLIPEKIRTESGRISDKASASMDIPLVYLMNDAVESFLVFRNVRMTGGISQSIIRENCRHPWPGRMADLYLS